MDVAGGNGRTPLWDAAGPLVPSSQVSVASAGIFGSAVRAAAGAAKISSGSGSSLTRRASAVVKQQVAPALNNGSFTGKVLSKAKDIATNSPNSLSGRVLNKVQQAAQNPTSLTSRVLTKAKTAAGDPTSLTSRLINRVNNSAANPDSLTAKIIGKAQGAVADPNSLTGKILNRAKQAGGDPNSLTGRALSRAKSAAGDPNSLTNRILNKAKVVVEDPTGVAGKIIDRAKVAVNDPNAPAGGLFERGQGIVAGDNLIRDKLLKDKLVDQIKQAIEKNGGLDQVVAEVQKAIDNGGVAEVGAVVDAANANQNGQNDQLVRQLLSAGIQAGGQVLSSAIEARAAGGFASQGGGFAPASFASEPVAVESFTPETLPTTEVAAPVAKIDLELSDLRFVDGGNGEQGPGYRLTVTNDGNTDVTSEITVALLGSMIKDSDDNVSVLGSLESLTAGTTKKVDLRLPKGSQSLTFLTAAVALTDAADADETDNIVTVESNSVRLAR
jgi:hypothetical protein